MYRFARTNQSEGPERQRVEVGDGVNSVPRQAEAAEPVQ